MSWLVSQGRRQKLSRTFRGVCWHFVRNPSAPYRRQIPQNREKRVSEAKGTQFPPPQKRGFGSKNPHFYMGHHRKMRFLTQNVLPSVGKWVFFNSELRCAILSFCLLTLFFFFFSLGLGTPKCHKMTQICLKRPKQIAWNCWKIT